MELPFSGKIVIIDNEPKEAAPLLQILSKKRLPHVYFTGDQLLLPDEGNAFEDVRIIFLDINLTSSTTEQATLAQLSTTLKRFYDRVRLLGYRQ